jgi:hypothetical protein
VDVRGCETKDPESSVHQQVLTAIVFDQSRPVVATVVLDDESRRRVVKISPTDELILGVVEVCLDLWAGQTALDQQPTKAGFHRRFGRRGNRREAT